MVQAIGSAPEEINTAKPIAQGRSKQLKKTSDIVSGLQCYRSLKVTTKVPALSDNRTHPCSRVKLPKIKANGTATKETDNANEYYDIWNSPVELTDELRDLEKLQIELVGRQAVKVPEQLYQKPTLRSSVETPMAGLSYNPSEQDHQSLLKVAVEVEEAGLRKEEKLAKMVTKNFVKKTEIDPNSWMKEMSQGLGSDDDDIAADGGEGSNEDAPVQKPTVCRRKTKAQRARERKNKMLQLRSKSKINIPQVGIKKMLKEFRQKEAETEERIKKRDEKKIEKLKAGNESRVDEDIVVSLTNELKGNLRQVTVAGNLLEERFKSFQKRGLIEAKRKRTDDKKKKVRRMKKTKMFVKRNFREIQT